MDEFNVFTHNGSKTFSNINELIKYYLFDLNQYIPVHHTYIHSRRGGNPNNITLLGFHPNDFLVLL